MSTHLFRREARDADRLVQAFNAHEPFVAITRSGARHVVDPGRGLYRRTHEGRSEEWPLFAVLGEVSAGRSLVLLVVADDERVVAVQTSPVGYLAPLHSRRVVPRAA